MTMVVTAILLHVVAVERWKWPLAATTAMTAVFLIIDAAFLGANLIKIADGGWLPLAIGAVLVTLMTTWKTGRRIVAERLTERALPMQHAELHDLFLTARCALDAEMEGRTQCRA